MFLGFNSRLGRRRGLSILEASVALVILAGATLSSITLFHLGLRRQTQSSQRILAVGIAEQRLEELRYQSIERPGFRRLSSFNGTYLQDPAHPGFEIAVQAHPVTLHSPCSTFDEADEPRVLESSAFQILAVVRWNQRDPGVRLHTLISEPRAPYERIQFSGLFTLLQRDGERELSAALLDRDGQAIPGVKFQFWIRPRSANATLRRYRDGQRARVINRLDPLVSEDGPGSDATYAGGECIVTARARYFGQEIRQDSPAMELEP